MSFETLVKRLLQGRGAETVIYRSGPGTMVRMALSLAQGGRSAVLVGRTAAELAEYRALLTLFSPESSSADHGPALAAWNQHCVTLPQILAGGGAARRGWSEYMAALYALKVRSGSFVTLAGPDALLLRLPPACFFSDHDLRLTKGMDMAPELVVEQAVEWGYSRVPMVSVPGEVAVRGDILDIFCPGYSRPLRLEFFGDTLDDIRLFDASSQRSVADLAEMRMIPVSPVIVAGEERVRAEAYWKELAAEKRLSRGNVAALVREADSGGRQLFSGVYYRDASWIEDWLPPDSAFLLPGRSDVGQALETAERRWRGFFDELAEAEDLVQPHSLVLRGADRAGACIEAASGRAWFEELRIGVPEDATADSLPEKEYLAFQELFRQPEAQERPWHQLVTAMRAWSAPAKTSVRGEEQDGAPGTSPVENAGKVPGRLILSFSSERARTRFLKLTDQEGISLRLRLDREGQGVFALVSPYRKGRWLQWENTLVLGEDVLQPQAARSRKPARGAFQGLDRYDSLREGDFLVHRDYGVGVFGGLHRLNLGGTENDYLLLYYASEDKLYLPVDRLSLVQRFKATDGTQPAPDRLGGSLWAASKDKARKAIEKIAADLVEMYALRKVVKGFRYGPVGEMYREFEASFGFEETPDQARAIEDVLSDMEKPEPMDRLVCGDVGFGKTEVAMRAAFRAALEGRQVAMLCPTTILAEQHYQTFRSRLAGFPLNVAMLSRFVSRARQREVLEATAKGQVDILIGTHRLLSKDVVLPNLGLLVLDEEQRFGVRHKERLKEMRKNVDALTLTATPIPRTLQLSLSGIRELSIIETPPPERKPVATALIERDDDALRSILERELARDGQVFWVYNRVQGLDRVVEYVKKLVPTARVGMAHGQMSESALEEAMHKFWHGELDVLVCTAIIESGLDFPRANTLIVDQAQLFGLGQLYQLRGRVGRSDRQAYAIFVTPDPDRLPEVARQRMRIILDMDYLGAGFQVAMEDLRIRGAGNILGESQSGHLNRLGLDLFLEMLEEAVAKLKGQPLPAAETELSIGIPVFIPEQYMADSKERLRYYKLLSSAQSDEAQQDIEFEMRDRFGALPPELRDFAAVLSFKRQLGAWSVHKADILPDKLRLSLTEASGVDPTRLVAFVAEEESHGRKARLVPPAVLEIALGRDPGEGMDSVLSRVRLRLAGILERPLPDTGPTPG